MTTIYPLSKLTFSCESRRDGLRKQHQIHRHSNSVFTARAAITSGLHGYNGMLVGMLIAVFSEKLDYYWWLLLPVTFTAMSW